MRIFLDRTSVNFNLSQFIGDDVSLKDLKKQMRNIEYMSDGNYDFLMCDTFATHQLRYERNPISNTLRSETETEDLHVI